MKLSQLAPTPLTLLILSCADGGSTGANAGTESVAPTTAAAPSNVTSASPAASTAARASEDEAKSASGSGGLKMPPLKPGFQRLLASPVPVPAGTTDDWIQWVGGPTDQDYDVIALEGAQSIGGHHALLLSIAEANPIGMTRKYTERDQLTSSSLGGVGAEGAISIPEGVVFRLKKGTYLAIQAHYLNATDKDVQGETYIDLKMVPKDPTHVVAGHFASTTTTISLPPHAESKLDVYCNIQEDIPILRMTNHQHYTGASVFTEVTDPTGKTQMLKQDDVWDEHWALAPNYDNFPVTAPLMLKAGSMLHTRCVWNNTTDKQLTFPEEMCVFATVILGEREISCIDNKFAARSPTSSGSAAHPGGQAGAASLGSAGAGPSASMGGAAGATAASAGAAAPAASGACSDTANKELLAAPEFEDSQRMCARMCLGAADSCSTDCLTMNTKLTPACAACSGGQLTCAMKSCIGDCAAGFMSESCMPCLETNCGAAYHACSGL